MNERIKKHIDLLFESAPKTRKAMDLKEELLLNTNEKYQDLISNGYTDEDAYQNVVESIGDVTELFDELEDKNLYNMREADRRKRALVTSIAIGLYIFAGITFFTCVLIEDSIATHFDVVILGLILAAAICIIPTCMLVYVANMYPEYQKKEENLVESLKESRYTTDKDKAVKDAVSAIIWMLALIFYFIISFITMAWYITWVIFLIGGCIQAITELIFSLKRNS